MERLVIYCLVPREDEDIVEPLRQHYADDPRVQVIIDRRNGEDRREERAENPSFERRAGTDRRRGVVPRRLRDLPPELYARADRVRWVQRMLPIGVGTESLEFDEVLNRVRKHDPEAPTELYWRVYERMHSRLQQLYSSRERADRAVIEAYGRVLDALDDPAVAVASFESLLYNEVESLYRATEVEISDIVLDTGLRVDDPTLDEKVLVTASDPDWLRIARAERDTLVRRLGSQAVRIEHIGSTAVEGVASRPIVDLLIGVRHVPADRELKAELVNMGYSDCGSAGRSDRDYFRRRGQRAPVDLHIVEFEGKLWRETVAVREHLRRSPADAHRWGLAKTRAARQASDSLMVYAQVREPALAELLGRVTAATR